MNRGAVVCVWLLAVGCAATPPSRSGPALRAIEVSDNAAVAFADGDNYRAVRDYQRALELSRAADDRDGIASILANLAIVQRRLGDRAAAHESLAEILGSGSPAFTPLQRSRAVLLEAMLFVDEEDFPRAEASVTTGLSLCHAPECPLKGKFLNLRARIALALDDPRGAIATATEALAANEAQGDPVEEANSLRLLADARIRMTDLDAARTLYESAYRLDDRRGNGVKVAADLRGIGRTFLGAGDVANALRYYRRALAISESAGDGAGKEEALRLIQEAERDAPRE